MGCCRHLLHAARHGELLLVELRFLFGAVQQLAYLRDGLLRRAHVCARVCTLLTWQASALARRCFNARAVWKIAMTAESALVVRASGIAILA